MNIKFILQYAICLILTVIATHYIGFNVTIDHVFINKLDLNHKGSVVDSTVYISHRGQIKD